MTTKGNHDTGRNDGRERGHPVDCGDMAKMMENCGCGPMMAKMKAACTGAGKTEDTPKEGGTK